MRRKYVGQAKALRVLLPILEIDYLKGAAESLTLLDRRDEAALPKLVTLTC
jgi:hypothetical protein